MRENLLARVAAVVLPAAIAAASAATPEQVALAWEPYDGPSGVSCEQYNAGGSFVWRHKGSDWVDADGAEQGDKPFATIAGNAGDTRLAIDVPKALLKERIYLLRYGKRQGPFTIHSREADTSQPRLLLTLTGGGSVTLLPQADTTMAGLYSSTKRCTTELAVQGNTLVLNAAIWLAWPRLPENIASARLELTPVKALTSPVDIGLYAGRIPRETAPRPRTTGALAMKYPADAGIGADPAVLYFEGFDRATIRDWAKRTGGYHKKNYPSLWGFSRHLGGTTLEDRVIQYARSQWEIDSGLGADDHGFWRLTYEAKELSGTHAPTVMLPDMNGGKELDELYIRYYVRFSPDFRDANPCTGGKLPGIAGDTTYGGHAGVRGFGQAWSARNEYHLLCDQANPLYQAGLWIRHVVYYYHAQQLDYHGDNEYGTRWDASGLFETNKWHCLEQRLKINSVTGGVANADGDFETWLDGYPSAKRTGIMWRGPGPYKYNPENNPEKRMAIQKFWGTVHHGGQEPFNTAAAQNGKVWIDIDQIVAARQRIGCMAPGSKARSE
jgi:hypothetical protein